MMQEMSGEIRQLLGRRRNELIDGGDTRNRFATPPMEKPIS